MDTPNGIRAYTHVHHTGPVIEMSWDIQERIEYINTWKHEEERPLRLALIKDVTDELPRGYTAEDIELLLQLSVAEEANAEAAELTKADLRALLNRRLLDEAAVRGRLTLKGYAAADIDLLLELWTRPAAA